MSVSNVDGANVLLTANGISAAAGSTLNATGNMSLTGTDAGTSDINLAGSTVSVTGNLNLATARDAVLGNTDAGSITANLSGSLSQSALATVNANGLTATTGGDIRLLNDPSLSNDLGHVAGSAGGSVLVEGARGVASPGLSAGADVQLTAVPTAGLDLIGHVTAGNMLSLTSTSNVVVQGTSNVSARDMQFDAPVTTVHGTLKPGGLGTIGTATASGDLSFVGTGSAQIDVASLTSFDTVVAAGAISTAPTTSLQVLDRSGGTIPAGSFQPVTAASGPVTYKLPVTWGVSPTNPYVILTALPPAPSPVPGPVPGPVPVTVTVTVTGPVAVPGAISLPAATLLPAAGGVVPPTTSDVVLFAQQFADATKREDKSGPSGEDKIVLTDAACRPGG
jgi:hypothetical protein